MMLSTLLLSCLLSYLELSLCWKPVFPGNEQSSVTYYGKHPAPSRLVASQSGLLKPVLSQPQYLDLSSLQQPVPKPNILVPQPQAVLASDDDCGNYKVGFIQDLYFQYVQYKFDMPPIKEFTLCMWAKFANHTNDHPLFSYAVDGNPRAILAWISNTERSSYFSLAVAGHTFFRLNYPIRLNKWYHMCYSWNGNTGEWQLWVNAERVGRGFHNRLVGHTIPEGGIAITGQEQRQPGGGFLEGNEAPKGSGGMLGEITMVQMYNVALSAGKAHRNHKHHHAHKFHHEGVSTTTQPPPITMPPPQELMHPLLTSGQITPMLNLNFAGGPPQPADDNTISSQFLNMLMQQELAKGSIPIMNHQFLFKRESEAKNRTKREDKKQSKRGLILVGDSLYDDGQADSDLLFQGLGSIGPKPMITDSDREPASAEVRAVMAICSGCAEEPFEKALVFSWRTVPKKLYSGAFYIAAVPECGAF